METDFLFLKIMKMYRDLKKTKRRWSIHPTNIDWHTNGYFKKEFENMRNMDSEQFFLHTRMTRPVYDQFTKLLCNKLRKPGQRIGPEERLSITLLYLAHGAPLQNIASNYKLGKTTIRNIILEGCEVIWRVLSPIYVSEPTESQYRNIAADFDRIWNIPNCVGAIDGKKIDVNCPKKIGAPLNHCEISSVTLVASCDAKYAFTAVSVGGYGNYKGGGKFRYSRFGDELMDDRLPLPPEVPLSGASTQPFPHFFVGDCAFPVGNHLMRPYAGTNLTRTKQIFNYRLSRAHRVIENSFGILTARWKVLRTTLEWFPKNCETIILACVALHNFIIVNDTERCYCPDQFIDYETSDYRLRNGAWRNDLADDGGPLRSAISALHRGTDRASRIRDCLADYFSNEGFVPFQDSVDLAIHDS